MRFKYLFLDDQGTTLEPLTIEGHSQSGIDAQRELIRNFAAVASVAGAPDAFGQAAQKIHSVREEYSGLVMTRDDITNAVNENSAPYLRQAAILRKALPNVRI